MFLVCVLYFAEGVPYGFVYGTLAIYFRTLGMDLREIGVLSLIGLVWTLKALWAPLIDRFGRRYMWIVPSQFVIAACIIFLALAGTGGAGIWLWPVLILLCLASATQDIAIDAYTIDMLNSEEYGIASGYRTGAYRVAILAAGGGLVAISEYIGWSSAFIAVAVLIAGIAAAIKVFPAFKLPHIHMHKQSTIKNAWNTWIDPVNNLFRMPNFWIVIVFVLTFKLGDALMASMVSPFWVDKGLTRIEMGFLSTASGMVMTIAGALLGGWFTSKYGILKGLWILGALQALSNLGYAGAAIPAVSKYAVYGASAFESFSSGLGSSAFMAFMMRLCNKEYSASQYAIFSTLFGFTRSIAGFIGGFGAKNWGYAPFFAFTFLTALPAFAILPWVNKILAFRDAESV
ncbi:MAG: MFS transporter [Deltaproteobacteria bacterium]|nr:MFS transporter [Deltaproteobacteria bacterium]